ncbi:unnamed protein product, partial [Ectocarpus sp. 12 AP-2014]
GHSQDGTFTAEQRQQLLPQLFSCLGARGMGCSTPAGHFQINSGRRGIHGIASTSSGLHVRRLCTTSRHLGMYVVYVQRPHECHFYRRRHPTPTEHVRRPSGNRLLPDMPVNSSLPDPDFLALVLKWVRLPASSKPSPNGALNLLTGGLITSTCSTTSFSLLARRLG